MRMAFTIDGLDHIDQQLRTLPIKAQKKVVRTAVRAALKPMQTEARRNAVSMVGGEMGALLNKHIVIKAPKRQKIKGNYLLRDTLREGVEEFDHVSQEGKMSYIPSAIEYGHDSAQPIPFMRKASDSELRNAPAIFSEVVRKELK